VLFPQLYGKCQDVTRKDVCIMCTVCVYICDVLLQPGVNPICGSVYMYISYHNADLFLAEVP
jgi:rubrerythrin